MIKLAAVLDKLLSLFQFFIEKYKDAKAQRERDRLENDPYDFFADYFDGMSESSNKTSEANKTNSSDSAK